MATVSVCMIVKNEEKFLARCLESLKNHVDEIIVVDTGSTDKTKEIAASYGAKVFDHQWKQDFAEARQYAKEQATSDWIFQIDADEYFLGDEAKQIKEALESATTNGLSIRISNLVGEGQLGPTHQFCRMFRNLPEVTYRYKIHEQVSYKGDHIDQAPTNIRIMHSGYVSRVIEDRKKHERNLDILEKELKADPKNGFTYLNFSNEYLCLNRFEEAIEFAQKAYKYGAGKSYQPKAVMNIIQALMQLEDHEQALKVIADAKEFYEGYTDLNWVEGAVLEKQGREQEAMLAYEACMLAGEANPVFQTIKGVSSILPLERLAALSLRNRKLEDAVAYLTEHTKIDRYNDNTMRLLLSILRKAMSEEEIVEYLEAKYEEETPINLAFKVKMMHAFRMKKGICLLCDKIKSSMSFEDMESRVYMSLYFNQNEEAKRIVLEALESGEPKGAELAMAHYFFSGDEEVKSAASAKNETVAAMFAALDGKEGGAAVDAALYIRTLGELVLLQRYDLFEKLLGLHESFEAGTRERIAQIFHSNLNDDLAVEYYAKHLRETEQPDRALYVTMATLLNSLGSHEEAIMFAQQAFAMDQKNFKPIEIMIEACKALGREDDIVSICEAAIEMFPSSKYIIQQLECVL